MLYHTKGNLIDLAEKGQFDVIVQGCNCQNTMGSGLAKEIRARYPGAYQADQMTIKGDKNKIGAFSKYHTGKFIIINAYTQYHYLPRGLDHFEYEGFQIILDQLSRRYVGASFGLPYIGMGLAGGNKNLIIPMIEKFAKNVSLQGGSVTLVDFGS